MQKLSIIVCDSCGLQANAESDYNFNEFISVEHHCGYGSIHEDGKYISIDLCQQCFADMCGDRLKVNDNRDKNSEDSDDRSESNQLEYSNIFEVICNSKAEAYQLKNNSDLEIVVRDILAKNKVSNNLELTAALKRVKQLWDAQIQSEEGNELNILADLICTYEKGLG